MKRVLWSLVWILTAALFCSAQNTLYFPQVADGLQSGGNAWITAIAVTNTAATGTAVASGAITLTQDNGSPWTLSYNDGQGGPTFTGSSISFQIAGGQTRLFVTKASGNLTSGFATVTANRPVAAGLVFIEFGNFGAVRIAEAGVPASPALTRQTTIATRGQSDTGIAVANPGASSATITFQLLDANGVAVLPAVNRNLAPNGHTAFFVSGLFPSLPQGFFGTLQITSGTPIVAIALIFEDTGQFATLPVFPLQ